MSYNSKNYNSQGGDKIFIGGEITILSSGKIKVENGANVEGLQTEDIHYLRLEKSSGC